MVRVRRDPIIKPIMIIARDPFSRMPDKWSHPDKSLMNDQSIKLISKPYTIESIVIEMDPSSVDELF